MPEFGGRQREAFFQLWLPDGHVIERSDFAGRSRSVAPGRPEAATPFFWNLPLPGGKPGRAVSFTFDPSEEDHERGVGAALAARHARSRAGPHAFGRVSARLRHRRGCGERIDDGGRGARRGAGRAPLARLTGAARRRRSPRWTKTRSDSRLAGAHLPAELTPIGTAPQRFPRAARRRFCARAALQRRCRP